jgi:hypothetical protein
MSFIFLITEFYYKGVQEVLNPLQYKNRTHRVTTPSGKRNTRIMGMSPTKPHPLESFDVRQKRGSIWNDAVEYHIISMILNIPSCC